MERFIEYTTVKGKKVLYRDLSLPIDAVSAYLIGNLGYDGTYVNNRDCFVIETTDHQILELAKQHWSPTLLIKDRGKRCSAKVNSISDGFRSYLPRPLCKDLKRFGIMDLKPNRGFYGIPDALKSICILGAVDAEGWWTIRHRKDCRVPRLNFGMRTSALLLNRCIQAWLTAAKITSRLREDGFMSELRIETVNEAVKFGDYVYSILPNEFYKNKKLEIFMEYKQKVYLPHNRENCGEVSTIRSQGESKVQRLGEYTVEVPDTSTRSEEIVHIE